MKLVQARSGGKVERAIARDYDRFPVIAYYLEHRFRLT